IYPFKTWALAFQENYVFFVKSFPEKQRKKPRRKSQGKRNFRGKGKNTDEKVQELDPFKLPSTKLSLGFCFAARFGYISLLNRLVRDLSSKTRNELLNKSVKQPPIETYLTAL